MIKQLTKINEVDDLIKKNEKVVFYKHSTRCNVSFDALRTIKSFLNENNEEIYLINVIEDRPISNYLELKSEIKHESPQLIIYNHGKPLVTTSHFGISQEFLSSHI